MTDTKLPTMFAILAVSLALPTFILAAGQSSTIDLSGETAGAEPAALIPVVGIWRIEKDGGKNVLTVDGRQWKQGNRRPELPTKRALSTAIAMRNSSIGCRPTPTILMRLSKGFLISVVARSPCSLKACRAASTRAPEFCST